MYYFFLAVIVIRYETTATARRALLLIVGAFFNDAITVAVSTGFQCVPRGDATTVPRKTAGALLIRCADGDAFNKFSALRPGY